MEEYKKCNICEKRKANMPIQLYHDDICDRCWIVYLKNQGIPDWVSEDQTYRYVRIKVRKILGYKT